MVLQYKSKSETRWKKYPGKDKSKVLAKGNYSKVLKRFRQIEFFKHRK